MSQDHSPRSHRNTNANGLASGTMLFGYRFAFEFVIKSCFMQEDRRVFSNLRKSFRGATIAAIGDLEASRKGEGDRLSTVAMRDAAADQI